MVLQVRHEGGVDLDGGSESVTSVQNLDIFHK